MKINEFLEILMLLTFGFSWPLNVLNALRAKTTKGQSLAFLVLIFSGYVCGIISKLTSPAYKWYVLFFYVLNMLMVGADIIIYLKNLRLDKQAIHP